MNLKHFLIFVASIALIGLAFVFRERLAELESLGLLGIFLINLLGNATVFLPAPAIASVVAGGILYPPLAVAASSALGGALGDMIGFILGHSGRHLFIKNHHKWYKFLHKWFHKAAIVVIFLFAFVPNPFFDLVGILAGMFHYSPVRFFTILLMARFLRNILLAYASFAVSVH